MSSANEPTLSDAAPPFSESRRLASLRRLRVLDTPPERDFDDLVVLAARIFDVPIALVSLVDHDRQWFKARLGLEPAETARSIAFCAHAIQHPDQLFVVEDTCSDPRFVDNPLVTGDPHVRFYAGAPIVSADGAALGTVCIMDCKAGSLDEAQRRCLRALARQASTLLEWRAEALSAATAETALLERNEVLEQDIGEARQERRRQQDALDAAEAALRQSQKMEALGQLTGGLAHDFNNLLTGITGSLELAQLRIAQGRYAELDRYLGVARTAAGRAASLTHRLLAFARRQTLDPKAVGVDDLIAGMEEMIRRTVGPEIAVAVSRTEDLWTALVDAHQLENVVLNLCINARDAMPDGGLLTIATGNRNVGASAVKGTGLLAGEYLEIVVADSGTGMSEEVMARAFDPFFTTKPLGLGTGLGLSMVHGFAHQSGGQVRIASALGAGTTMTLLLPRHIDAAEAVAEGLPGAPRFASGSGGTVLVVDDEQSVRLLVAEVLGDLGYGALEAEDGAAGLALLRSGARIDLLVTDVGLPGGLNGRQVADAARALRPGLKVLFITGYAESSVLGEGSLGVGMQVLTKPFSLEALSKRVADLLPDVTPAD